MAAAQDFNPSQPHSQVPASHGSSAGSAAVRRSVAPTENEFRRHQRMVRLAFDWMARTGGNQQKLVDLINDYWHARGDEQFDCDHTLLSRMLHPDAPYVATSRRLKAMQLQEALLTLCVQRHDVNVVQTAGDEELTWSSDDEHAFLAHRARLRQLREQGEACASAALNLLGELVVAVRGLDDRHPSNHQGETFRQRGAENLIMTLATLVDRGQAAGLLEHLQAAEGLAPPRADEIRRQQLSRLESTLAAVGQVTVNMHAYAGVAMFHLAQRERGMILLIDAVRRGQSSELRHDPHWETLLELLERLHKAQADDARKWSDQARAVAQAVLEDHDHPARRMLLVRAWARLQLPELTRHWSDADPSLVARVQRLVAADQPARPTAGPTRAASRLLGAAVALLLSAAAAWTVAAPGLLSSDDAAVAYNIRGREARGPSTPPPPPPSAEQPA
jgi:hypothetical protein